MILQNFVHISKWLSRNDNCRCFRAGVCFEAAFQRNLRSFLGNWGATLGITKYRLVSLANSFLGDFVESSSFQRCSHHGVRLTAWFFTKCEGGRSARSNDAERHPYSLPSQRGVFTFFLTPGKKHRWTCFADLTLTRIINLIQVVVSFPFLYTPIPGEMIQYWLAHIFQTDWFNHQLLMEMALWSAPNLSRS